ncbi:uncharacterized protein LOC132726017 [Ruditapes philippinarum]|uniref:uncharacterized protein LOC132726017 n=1 Tax=Ruditapes philippinarum TaxID=129788 RepID=UPI00295BBE79|nr:uncharacterized protein LOC132726017 [Ruditapes philippinarum]
MEVSVQFIFLMFFMNSWNFNKAYVPSGYLGCYIDKIARILSHRMPNSAHNSGDQCKKQCKAAGYRYAGTEFTYECFCGNFIKEYPKGSKCTAKCPGNKNEVCGGTWHISLYDTKVDDSGVYVPSGYLGCYIDKTVRILSHRMPKFANNNGDLCKQRCKAAGYRYAGTEYTVECFCGNNIKDYPKGSGCTAKCPGNKKEVCGGTWHISLYDTQENGDLKYCDIYDVCPAKWKCRNKKIGFLCLAP